MDAVRRRDRDRVGDLVAVPDRRRRVRVPEDRDPVLGQADVVHRVVELLGDRRGRLRLVVGDADHEVCARGRSEDERGGGTRERQPHGCVESVLHQALARQDCRTARTASRTVPAPNRTGSSAGSPVSSRDRAGGRARLVVVQRPRVERDRRDPCGAQRQRHALVQLDELGERRDRIAGIALDLGRARHMAEDVRVRSRAVHEPERDTGVRRMRERALALDEEQLSPTLRPFDDEPLRRARDEVRDDRVDGDAPAGDRDAGLAGGDERPTSGRAAAPPGRARSRPSSCRSRSRSRP